MKTYNQDQVDQWVNDECEVDAHSLLREQMPKIEAKLVRLDKRIEAVLAEIKQIFPDAEYYTASGGFNLLLGEPHDTQCMPQQQRHAWTGNAQIGDGDW